MLKAGTVILERDSWSLSLIPRLSSPMFWVVIQVEHQHKASVFDNLGMKLNNQPSVYRITFPTFNLSMLHKISENFSQRWILACTHHVFSVAGL